MKSLNVAIPLTVFVLNEQSISFQTREGNAMEIEFSN
jgi:hypothetical protein